jgi:hypothetical protein
MKENMIFFEKKVEMIFNRIRIGIITRFGNVRRTDKRRIPRKL